MHGCARAAARVKEHATMCSALVHACFCFRCSQKAAIRQAQEAAEKKQADEFAAEQAKQAERKAKTDAAIAKSKAQAEERAAKVAAEKAEREAERAAKYGATGTATASKGESTKSSKDQVVRVSARAERIAARKAAGEDAPTLFGN